MSSRRVTARCIKERRRSGRNVPFHRCTTRQGGKGRHKMVPGPGTRKKKGNRKRLKIPQLLRQRERYGDGDAGKTVFESWSNHRNSSPSKDCLSRESPENDRTKGTPQNKAPFHQQRRKKIEEEIKTNWKHDNRAQDIHPICERGSGSIPKCRRGRKGTIMITCKRERLYLRFSLWGRETNEKKRVRSLGSEGVTVNVRCSTYSTVGIRIVRGSTQAVP